VPFEYAASDDVRHQIHDGILAVTIDRPEKRNPLSLGVLARLRAVFEETADNPLVKVAVVTGAGSKAFASGGDLGELARYRCREDAEAIALHGRAALDAIRFFPVPVIARLNGVALGGGAELALACDLRWSCPSATFGFIHARLGLSAPWGGAADLARLVGPTQALQLMVRAAVLNADEGRALRVIDLVCPGNVEFDHWFERQLAAFHALSRAAMVAYKAISSASRRQPSPAERRLETQHFCELWCDEAHWMAMAQLTGERG
jgi:enoyl-CoA hydratase